MEYSIPRIVFAGTNSGCGKTTITCAVLQALVNRHLGVSAFKCGPDYIDPMFHSRIIGAKSANLDSFFFDRNTLNYILAKNALKQDISIIEGVMGFYDGAGLTSTKASTYEIAQLTHSPVVLIINAKGACLSVLAMIQGFLDLYPENNICAVILNQCTAMTFSILSKEILRQFENRVKPLGYFPSLPDCTLESRHLGLITAAEVSGLQEKMQHLAEQAERSIDLNGLLLLAQQAPSIHCTPVKLPCNLPKVKIGVAHDRSFCFYYQDNLYALTEMGAELVFFSPLSDKELPLGLHGLYLGGGYPELYAQELSHNTTMLSSIRHALESGMPCIAECGGFMYLTQTIADTAMAGYLPGKCFNTKKLTRFGYITLSAQKDNLLCQANESIAAHEFHYWDCTAPGSDFTARKQSGKQWDCAIATETLYAGYPHFHFYSNPHFAINFYNACLKEKHSHV